MLDLKLLKRALVVGILLQLLLVASVRAWPWLRFDLLFGAMLAAAVAGLLYARDLARGFLAAAFGGAVVGTAGGLVAVGAAHLLGEQPERFLPYAVMITAFTGAVGGLFGQADALLRAFYRNLR